MLHGALALLAVAMSGPVANPDPASPRPIVIAHRGASGERPEHTLAAYDRAIDQGADVIEPDLVVTRDGVLVARHENEISGTTDVADHPEFAARRTTRTIDGATVTGWFTEDFTLAELRILRARERLPQLRPANARFDGLFAIPTFDEILQLAAARSAETGRPIGVYPETKHPTYFDSIGLSHDAPLIDALERHGLNRAGAPVYVQSFEVGNLQRLRPRLRVTVVQLVAAEGAPADRPQLPYARMLTPAGLRDVARYADAIGPDKRLVLDPSTLASTGLVARAHDAGLKVHPWTMRAENYFLPARLRRGEAPGAHGDLAGEIDALLAEGVDGLFSDFPAISAQRVRTHGG